MSVDWEGTYSPNIDNKKNNMDVVFHNMIWMNDATAWRDTNATRNLIGSLWHGII